MWDVCVDAKFNTFVECYMYMYVHCVWDVGVDAQSFISVRQSSSKFKLFYVWMMFLLPQCTKQKVHVFVHVSANFKFLQP